MKRLSESPRPGCSKDSDDRFLKPENVEPDFEEILMEMEQIHKLLPRFKHSLIYQMLCNNKFARNRMDLALQDLLQTERPAPQYFRKRKSSDDICIVECKKNSNVSLQKDQVNTETAVEKTEQHVKSMEIEEMKKNVPEAAVSNDTNNLIAEQIAIPLKKVTLKSLKLDPVAAKCDETIDDINKNADNLMHTIAQDKKKSKSLPDNKTTCPVAPVLQPAKLTLETNFQQSSQNIEMHSKSAVPILSPPKLRLTTENPHNVHINAIPIVCPNRLVPRNVSNVSRNMERKDASLASIYTANVSQYYNQPSSSAETAPNIPDRQRANSSKACYNFDQEAGNAIEKQQSTLSVNYGLTVASHSEALDRIPSVTDHGVQQKDASKDADYKEVKPCERKEKHIEKSAESTNIILNEKANALYVELMFPEPMFPRVKTPYIKKLCHDYTRDYYEHSLNEARLFGHLFETLLKFERQEDLKRLKPRPAPKEKLDLSYDYKEVKPCERKEKHIEKSAESTNIILNEKANALYVKLIPKFPRVKTPYIKKLCHDYTRDYEHSLNEEGLFVHLFETLLTFERQETLKKLKPRPAPTEEPEISYDMNEQYADLLTIFPDADPVYLRKIVEELQGNHERIKEFVQSNIEHPDYPTKTQYLAKKKITEQQKQYTTDFKVQQFLEIFPDPFSYFENDKRNCQFNPHAIDFLKYHFSKLRVKTLQKAYSKYTNNLSLTAKALEALSPDMKTKRQSNKMVQTENIPFLQECAFIQHKAELRKYLDRMKAKEEREFNELKAKGQLFECQCCYDNECMPSKCSTCEEGHIFCNSCIVRSTDAVLGDGNTRVDCLLKCGCEFPISVLQRVLPPTKYGILLCKRQEAEIMQRT
ncbi:uncharacterized protein [Temnothorax longispinosus]|uniref:uncharacterized protein isoform X2 n=1 Tax=Temnothorax longispinosus TaxID=300112 RepID=UPI003A997D6C